MEPIVLDNATDEIRKLIAGIEAYAEADKVRALTRSASAASILEAIIADAANARWLWSEWDHAVSDVESNAEEMLANL